MKKEIFALGLVGLVCTGCAKPGTVADVAAAEQALTAAETAASAYTTLPSADPAVVAKIRSADNTAYAAVKAAENNTGTIDAALTAISAFQSVIPK